MLVIRVQIKVAPENRQALITAMKEDLNTSREFEGCIQYNVYQDLTDDNAILLYEEWESQNEFDSFRASQHFKDSGTKLFPLIDESPDTAYFSVQSIQ